MDVLRKLSPISNNLVKIFLFLLIVSFGLSSMVKSAVFNGTVLPPSFAYPLRPSAICAAYQ
jgi:hypothetical protein